MTSSAYNSRDSVYNMVRVLARQIVGLSIVHLNAQSLNNKNDEFKYLFVSAGIDVICVSETWFPLDVPNSVFNLQGFKLFRSDRRILVNGIEAKARGGGVAIYFRNGIQCKQKLFTHIGGWNWISTSGNLNWGQTEASSR